MPTVYINLRPHLKEYYEYISSMSGSSYDLVLSIIKPFLSYTPKNFIPPKNSFEYFCFELPNFEDKDIRNNSVFIPDCNHKTIRRIFREHFDNIFFIYCDDKVRYFDKITDHKGKTAKIKNTILQFCLDFNMSYNDDMYELLKKSYYREKVRRSKTSKKTKLNTKFLSLYCPSNVPLTFL